jgi:dihydroorotate dehydrogenase
MGIARGDVAGGETSRGKAANTNLQYGGRKVKSVTPGPRSGSVAPRLAKLDSHSVAMVTGYGYEAVSPATLTRGVPFD